MGGTNKIKSKRLLSIHENNRIKFTFLIKWDKIGHQTRCRFSQNLNSPFCSLRLFWRGRINCDCVCRESDTETLFCFLSVCFSAERQGSTKLDRWRRRLCLFFFLFIHVPLRSVTFSSVPFLQLCPSPQVATRKHCLITSGVIRPTHTHSPRGIVCPQSESYAVEVKINYI